MAHHLAGLIDEAENGATAAKRSKAGRKAVETILLIWEKRRLLPGNAHPLAPYKDVLAILQRLRPDDNPFWYYRHQPEPARERLAASLFISLTRLIIVLLYAKVPSGANSTEANSVAVEALSDEEQYVLSAIQQWAELLPRLNEGSDRKRKSKKDSDDVKINLDELALKFIDDIAATLEKLRNELKGEGSTEASDNDLDENI